MSVYQIKFKYKFMLTSLVKNYIDSLSDVAKVSEELKQIFPKVQGFWCV